MRPVRKRPATLSITDMKLLEVIALNAGMIEEIAYYEENHDL